MNHKVWLALGVLAVVALMVWWAGASMAATNNTTDENPIDWDRLEAEVDDKSGLTERLNDIADQQKEKLDKINDRFNKEVEDITANKSLSAEAKEKMLKNALRKKKQQSENVNKEAARSKSLADGSWKAQNRSAKKIVRTYSSGGYWTPPVQSGGSSSSGTTKTITLPCVDLDSIKPKLPGGGGAVPLTTTKALDSTATAQ